MAATSRARAKEFHFPLAVRWTGGRKVAVEIEGKPPLEVAPPPVFRGTEPDVWSPEDLLVAAAASCLAVTFTGVAERESLAFDTLGLTATGTVGRRGDGRFGFTEIVIQLRVAVAPADAGRARELGERAEAACLVSASLDLPVHAVVTVLEHALC